MERAALEVLSQKPVEVTLETELGRPLPSASNLHEHPMVRHKRVKRVRRWVATLMMAANFFRHYWVAMERLMPGKKGIRCTLTRIAPPRNRIKDGDNLQGAFKPVRDQVAHSIGLDDGSPRWDWVYLQEVGAPAVRIKLEAIDRPPLERIGEARHTRECWKVLEDPGATCICRDWSEKPARAPVDAHVEFFGKGVTR